MNTQHEPHYSPIHASHLLLLTALGLLLLALTACSSSQDGKPTYGFNDSGAYDGSDMILPQRIAGFNPETDVDYDTLKAQTIYFGFDSTVIAASQRRKLDQISEWMSSNPGRQILLAGHTDDRGTLEYNRGLGERRAQAVRDYLTGLGCDPSQLHTISYGEERPLSFGISENDYAKNRRVQVGVVMR
ncbi:MAG: OmpA family protein [Verrucomicrobiota bacterium]